MTNSIASIKSRLTTIAVIVERLKPIYEGFSGVNTVL